MKSVSALKEWFLETDFVCWELYRGASKNAQKLISKQLDDIGIESSFEKLERNILNAGHQQYFIFVKNKASTSTGGFTQILELPRQQQQNQINGFSGASNGGRYYEDKIERLRDKNMDLRLENQTLKHKLELAEKEEKDPLLAGLGSFLGSQIMGFTPKTAQVGYLDREEVDNDKEYLDDDSMCFNTIIYSCKSIKKHVPDIEEKLELLAEMTEKNPKMVLQFLNQYIK